DPPPLAQREHEAARRDDRHPDRGPAIGVLRKDQEAEGGRPDDLQIRERREQRGGRRHVSTREAPVTQSSERSEQQEERGGAQRPRRLVAFPWERQRNA